MTTTPVNTVQARAATTRILVQLGARIRLAIPGTHGLNLPHPLEVDRPTLILFHARGDSLS